MHSVHHVPYSALFADRCGTFVGQNLFTHYLHYEYSRKVSSRPAVVAKELIWFFPPLIK